MLQNDTKSPVDQLNQLDDSTTHFLESLRGDTIRLLIISQDETKEFESTVIKRVVKLYFESADRPVLYCVSYLKKDKLSAQEYKSLLEDRMPIGKVFQCLNEGDCIKKTNISVTRGVDKELAACLNVKSPIIVSKKYDYWIGEREVGQICEFFNEESLERI